MSTGSSRNAKRKKIAWMVAPVLVAAAWVVLLILFGEQVRLVMLDLLERVDQLGVWGPVLFIVAVTCSMLVLLPGMIFTLGGGFLFGVGEGMLYVLIGTAIGASISFFIGRYLGRSWVHKLLVKRPRMQRFVKIVEKEGMRFILITRMVPFFPFKLSNYVFGATNVAYPGFLFATCVGIIPISLTNVYAGSLASDLATLGVDTVKQSPITWALYASGFVVAAGFVWYVSRLARKALDAYVDE